MAAYRRIFEKRPDALLTQNVLQHLKALGACDPDAVTVEQALWIERPGRKPEPAPAEPPPPPAEPPPPRRTGLARLIRRVTKRSDDQACT